jgi:LytR cell envelope-related transcriptional attenuator
VTMPDPAPRQVSRSQHGRRRRPLPAIGLMVVLGLVATVVWIRTLDTASERTDNACAPPQTVAATAAAPGSSPAPQPQPGEVLPATALDDVDPLPPDAVKVRVLNGNGQRGQASLVDGVLTSDLGFARAAEPANDSVYPAFDLDCHAQIRFGQAGAAAGRTLSLVVPCAELVRDARQDDTVDLALGKRFTQLEPSPEAKEVLRQLTELAAQPPDPAGGQQAAPATADPSLIALARATARC